MDVGPERREQDQFSLLGPDIRLLQQELGLASGTLDIVQIPDGHELALAELPGAAIDMPVIEFMSLSPLHVIPHVLECVGGKVRVQSCHQVQGLGEGLKKNLIDIFPSCITADPEIGRSLYGSRFCLFLTDSSWIL